MKFPSKLWPWLRLAVPIMLITLGVILNGYAAIQVLRRPSSPSVVTSSPTSSQPIGKSESGPMVIAPSRQSIPFDASGELRFGHFPYAEGNLEKMPIIGSYAQGKNQRFERLAPETARALMQLIYAARDDGVWIVPVSGFRSVAAQEKLFERQVQRKGSPEAAAKWSAPAGYSEHHTGYAVDLTDGRFPEKDITYQFAETDAFQWLRRNAGKFGFELSFPEKNPQGVSYEPWHWRFVGSPVSQALFQRARMLATRKAQ